MKKSVLIVGCGNVGTNLYHELAVLEPDRYDPYKGINEKRDIEYDFAFICVDTPMMENGECDLSQVKTAVSQTSAHIIILKSTVIPGTTSKMALSSGKRIVFSPEYYGTTQHCNNFDFAFTVLGGRKSDCEKVQQLLQNVYDARHQFHIVDSNTTELAKYMENSWLATKVSFCIQFWEIAKRYCVSYSDLRELFLLDPRVNRAHTFVYDDHPFWKSHCLDKDVPAIAIDADAEFLKYVIRYNNSCRSKYEIALQQK